MLVLTRQVGEKIKIGDDVLITVLRSRSDRVRIGITAPKNVKILREELQKRVMPSDELKTDNEGKD